MADCRFWIAAILGALLMAVPAMAALECPGAPRSVDVTVRVEAGTVTVDTGYSKGELTRIGRRFGSGGGHVFGMTRANFRSDMRTRVAIHPLGAGRYCVVPTAVDMDLGYSDFTVYIDRNYRAGTCEHQALRDHEDTHVAIYRDNLEQFAPLVKARLVKAVRQFKAVIITTPDGGADPVLEGLQREVEPVLADLQEAAEKANARIDTQASYDAVHDRCQNW
jgi:hypothetical protein